MADNKRLITDVFSEASDSLIRTLSGADIEFHSKLADNIFAVTSLAGGAGASTLISNVAYKLAELKYSVLVIDLNMCYPTQQTYFNLPQKLDADDLYSVIMGDSTLDNALVVKDNVYVLYAQNRLLYEKILTDSPLSSTNFKKILSNVKDLFDIVILDIPTRGELEYEITNVALFESSNLITVMNESTSCISSFNRLVTNLGSFGIQKSTHLVMNKRTDIVYPKKVFDTIGIYPSVFLPYDISITDSGLHGGVYIKDGKASSLNAKKFVAAIDELTEYFLEWGGAIRDNKSKGNVSLAKEEQG